MYENEKVYAIDLGEDLVIEKDPGKPGETTPVQPAKENPANKPRLVLRTKAASTSSKTGKKAPRRLHFALLTPLTFLMGPFAILLTPEGRAKKDWAALGTLMGSLTIAAVFWGRDLVVAAGSGPMLGPLMVLMGSVLVVGFGAWSRAVYLAGLKRPANHKLPRWFTRVTTVGVFGLLFPGMGLLAAGRPRRAAMVLGLLCVPVAALLLIGVADLWWPMIHGGESMMAPVVFEKMLMVAGLTLVLGALGWVSQALEGARLVQLETGTPGRRRGDFYGLALLGALAALFATAEPGPVARYLGREAQQWQTEGYQVLPLTMVRTAAFLDPGRTDYTVTEMEILEDMGRQAPAAELRHRLENDLAPYLEMVRAEEKARVNARRWAEARTASQQSFVPLGWYGPDPFPKKENPEAMVSVEDLVSGSDVDE